MCIIAVVLFVEVVISAILVPEQLAGVYHMWGLSSSYAICCEDNDGFSRSVYVIRILDLPATAHGSGRYAAMPSTLCDYLQGRTFRGKWWLLDDGVLTELAKEVQGARFDFAGWPFAMTYCERASYAEDPLLIKVRKGVLLSGADGVVAADDERIVLATSVLWKGVLANGLGMLTVACILLTARNAIVRHYRRRHSLCIGCGYCVIGLAGDVCPECGKPVMS